MPSGKWSSRATRHERGYGTEWDKTRLIVLKRDCYICQCPHCKAENRITPAQEVDHIIPRADFVSGKAKGNPESLDNLRAINKQCHKRISLEQRGMTYKPRQRISATGWPA